MTDYMEQQLMQESAQVEKEASEEELSAAVLESYLSMSAAFASIENAFECANICAFCEAAEIEKPSEATVVVESFWDSVKNVFETIIDWFRSVIKGFIGLFTSAKLQKLIAKLNTMDPNKTIKYDSNVGAMIYATTYIFQELENFKEKCIDNVPTQSEVDEIVEALEGVVSIKIWNKANIEKYSVEKGSGVASDIADAVKGSGEDEMPVGGIIRVLEEINKINIPKRGSALLKDLKFDKTKYTEEDEKNEGKDKVNKELVNAIKKAARLLAKAYDKITSGLIKVTDIAFHNEKVDEKSDDYKDNLKAAKEANKNKAEYNKDGDASNRPSPTIESANETVTDETVAESEVPSVKSSDEYFD